MKAIEIVINHHHYHGSEAVAEILAAARRIEESLSNFMKEFRMDATKLQSTLDALDAEVKTKVIPILQAVASGDQAAIDALQVEAQGILDALQTADGTTTSGGAPAAG